MIGQKQLLDTIDNLIVNNTLPRFIIIVGPKGGGKHQLVSYINKKLKHTFANIEPRIDDIRTMINNSYTLVDNMTYCIHDVDNMSNGAMNALLKITEEPPNRARFIITCEDSNRLLPTIKSRGTIFTLLPYSRLELSAYAAAKGILGDDLKVVLSFCTTPGMINSMLNYNIREFYEYVLLVVDNIDKVSISNVFKIGDKLSLRKNDSKYDLQLFFLAFMEECKNRVMEDKKYLMGVIITSKYCSDLAIKTLNKQMIFDAWLLAMRKEWI